MTKRSKKIIIYEPLAEHVEYIKRNIALNHINGEIHQTGIRKENGKVTIQYHKMDPGFGLHSKGDNSVEIELTDVSRVIEQSGADLGKFDCESAEQYPC